jgi:hypothetical protein
VPRDAALFRLKRHNPSATVAPMARPQATPFGVRPDVRARARSRNRWLRRLVLLAIALAFAIPIVVLVFDPADTAAPVPVPPAERLLPAGPPQPEVVAFQGTLRIFLPIAESRVTAVGYQAAGEGALALEPVGTQANAGVFTRLLRRLFGQDNGGIRYYLLGGTAGPDTGGLDVGAPAGNDVYAPVDGSIIAISERIIDDQPFGVRIDIQPSGSPGLVVSVTNLTPDESLTVGSTVAAARTKIGNVVDLSEVETSALARYTQDSGQHVQIEVHPAANLSLP